MKKGGSIFIFLMHFVSLVLFFTSRQSCFVSADPNEGPCPVSGTPLHRKNAAPCVFPIPPATVAAASVFGFVLRLFFSPSERQNPHSTIHMTNACASWLASCCQKRRGLRFPCLFLTLVVELLSSIQRLIFMEGWEVTVYQMCLKSISWLKGYDRGMDKTVPCAVSLHYRFIGKPDWGREKK